MKYLKLFEAFENEDLAQIKKLASKPRTFLSFRDSENVSLINYKNTYNTPTGIYSYPCEDYKDRILKATTQEEFIDIFPFKGRYEPKVIYFYELKDNVKIIDNNSKFEELVPYYKKIIETYKNVEYEKTTIDNVRKYVEKIEDKIEDKEDDDDEFKIKIQPLFYSFSYDVRKEKDISEIHKLWTLTYHLSDDEPTKWGNLLRKIEFEVLVDHGEGYIHTNEPNQALLLRSHGIFKSVDTIKINNEAKFLNSIKADLNKNKLPDNNEVNEVYKTNPTYVLNMLLSLAEKNEIEYVIEFEDILYDNRTKKQVADIINLIFEYIKKVEYEKIDKLKNEKIINQLIKTFGNEFFDVYFKKDYTSAKSGGYNLELVDDDDIRKIFIGKLLNADFDATIEYLTKDDKGFTNELKYFEENPNEIEKYKDLHSRFFHGIEFGWEKFFKDDNKEKENKYKDLEHKYELFKDSYEKSTGVAWDIDKFMQRAKNWTFYGDYNGYVAVRKQTSGPLKLVGIAGDLKSINSGMDDLIKENKPIWGMMTERLTNILVKRYNFYRPPKQLVRMVLKHISPETFGADLEVNKDGGIVFHYEDVGDTIKYFVGNGKYFKEYLLERDFVKKNKILRGVLKFFTRLVIKD